MGHARAGSWPPAQCLSHDPTPSHWNWRGHGAGSRNQGWLSRLVMSGVKLIEEQKQRRALRGAILSTYLQSAWRRLGVCWSTDQVFSPLMGSGHFGYLCQVPFRHSTALIPPTPQSTAIKKLLPPECAIMFSETQKPALSVQHPLLPAWAFFWHKVTSALVNCRGCFVPRQCVECEVLERGSKGRLAVGKTQIRVLGKYFWNKS